MQIEALLINVNSPEQIRRLLFYPGIIEIASLFFSEPVIGIGSILKIDETIKLYLEELCY